MFVLPKAFIEIVSSFSFSQAILPRRIASRLATLADAEARLRNAHPTRPATIRARLRNTDVQEKSPFSGAKNSAGAVHLRPSCKSRSALGSQLERVKAFVRSFVRSISKIALLRVRNARPRWYCFVFRCSTHFGQVSGSLSMCRSFVWSRQVRRESTRGARNGRIFAAFAPSVALALPDSVWFGSLW